MNETREILKDIREGMVRAVKGLVQSEKSKAEEAKQVQTALKHLETAIKDKSTQDETIKAIKANKPLSRLTVKVENPTKKLKVDGKVELVPKTFDGIIKHINSSTAMTVRAMVQAVKALTPSKQARDPIAVRLSDGERFYRALAGGAKGGGQTKVQIADTDWSVIDVANAGNQKDVDNDKQIRQSLNEIFSSYGATVSVNNKKKSLLKFGQRTTVGTGWESLLTASGSEVQETLLSTNGITTIVSSSTLDTQPIKVEYHTLSGGNLTFGVQEVTLQGTTPVALPFACARVSRMYNNDGTPLVGNIYIYEGGTRTDANTHLIITAGDQQTQKAQTSISSTDYWIITEMSVSVSAFTTKFASARIEYKSVSDTYWRPITQDISITSTSALSVIDFKPFRIVPANSDVRIAVKTNSSGVMVAGGFNGYLAN